jgi:hypothetical protein
LSAIDWYSADDVLGGIEVLLVALSVWWLAEAAAKRDRRRGKRAAVVGALVGLTLAQPFGVRATSVRVAAVEPGMEQRAPDQVHSMDVLGIPLVAFRPTTGKVYRVAGEIGDPDTWVKVRSWIWPALLTNATKVTERHGRGDRESVQLWQTKSGWRLQVSDPQAASPTKSYRLSFGVVSETGAVYWFVWPLLAVVVAIRSPTETGKEHSPGALQ